MIAMVLDGIFNYLVHVYPFIRASEDSWVSSFDALGAVTYIDAYMTTHKEQ